MNRLQEKYYNQIVPTLKKELSMNNLLALPRLEKITINMGMGDVSRDKNVREKVLNYMTQICGQRPQFRACKKSIAEFGVREGDPVGIRATLRGERAYEFFDKLVSVVLPRLRDFQGVKRTSFDKDGNYSLGLKEQIIFPEVSYDTIDRIRGLQITINTTAKNTEHALALLKLLGMPFAKED